MTNKNFEERIYGNYYNLFIEELLTHSLHFPLANLILEALVEGGWKYFYEPDAYILILTAIFQAISLTYFRNKKEKYILIGYLTGPLVYIALEAPLEGAKFFSATQHIAFWVFSISIGITAQINTISKNYTQKIFLILENVLRTLIPISMYIIFEAHGKNVFETIPTFFSDPAHIFLSIIMLLLGLVFGFINIQSVENQNRILILTEQLKNYSTWSLGENVFNQAIVNENIFDIKRVQRSILFIDIRGFTKWSEKQTPEKVVEMLNEYYLEAEKILISFKVLKTKYTADEIMVVFSDIGQCLESTLILNKKLNDFLAKYELCAGGGVHLGDVVEGLIGSEKHKLFDVMGDTVNTAKRFCESAKGSEILISEAVIEATEGRAFTKELREVTLKGKSQPYKVYPLENYFH